jgi:CBS domain-containing protein
LRAVEVAMKNIRPLVEGKIVHTVPPDTSVLDVARFMSEKRVGAIVILEGDRPVGVFSERDLMERVVIRGRSPAEIRVKEVMTRDILTGSPDDSYIDCMKKMQSRGCRHLPIVEGGRVVAMLSLRDLLKVEIDEKEEEIKWMNAYIHGVPPDRKDL